MKLVKQGKRPEDSGVASADEVRALYFAHPVDRKFVPRFGKPDGKAVLRFLESRGVAERKGQDLLDAMAKAGAG